MNRDYAGPTSGGTKFTTLAGTIGGRLSTPDWMATRKHERTKAIVTPVPTPYRTAAIGARARRQMVC
ncbi:MAG: hypothetical protein HYX87_00410 [Chloroflexi bacterium]|nr:hypothetical protein [Chloroflexota bacterium]